MKLYHLSENSNLTVLTPRIPECAVSMHEDTSTPRVCFGKSISGCLSALQDIPCKYYVYIPDEEIDIIEPLVEQVLDAKITGEVWCLKPVKVKCIGIIESYHYTNWETFYLEDVDDFITCFTYPWNWVEQYKF